VDFTVPALLLGIVVGGSALAGAMIALFGPRKITLFGPWRIEPLVSAAAGCIMMGWITVEIAMIGLGSWLQPFYFAVGLVMIGLAGLLQWAEAHQLSVSGWHQTARQPRHSIG
jgi:hypothetical protein